MTEDEIAAVHESAHAIFAVWGEWTKLAGPVVLNGPGCGDVVMSTDGEAIRRALDADPGFDRDRPRIELIGALLAGPIAERMLAESRRAALCEDELRQSSENDYSTIAGQLAALDPPRPSLLVNLERDVRRRLEQPVVRAAVERFAAILSVRRRIEAEEASAILEGILAPVRARGLEAAGKKGWRSVLAALRQTFRSDRPVRGLGESQAVKPFVPGGGNGPSV